MALPTIDPNTGKAVPGTGSGNEDGGVFRPKAPAPVESAAPAVEEEENENNTNNDAEGEKGGEGKDNLENVGGEGDDSEVVDLKIESIVKTKDGYTWKVDPTDPKSMVYKGKSLDELFRNAAANIQVKDKYIQKLEANRPRLHARSNAQNLGEGEVAEQIEFPQFGAVLIAEAQRVGITDVNMLSFGDAEWDKYAEENGDRAARRMEDRVTQVKRDAKSTFDKENAVALNNFALQTETEQVQGLLDKAGIAADDPEFDYDAILSGVFNDPTSSFPNKILKNGRIVAAAAQVINSLAVQRARAEGKSKTEEDIAAARENKTKNIKNRGVPAGGPGGKKAGKQQPAAKTMDEALRRAKAEFLRT